MIDRVSTGRLNGAIPRDTQRLEGGAPAGPAPQPAAARTTSKPIDVRALAAEPAPMDEARIAALRTAISAGDYPLDPDRIAAAMLASERTGHVGG